MIVARFQFHKGTIRTHPLLPNQEEDLKFQFHKGTIRTELRKLSPPLKTNFNSIKVRLEHDSDFVSQVLAHLFQFHKGTIRTLSVLAGTERSNTFQFHKGTIRTHLIVDSPSLPSSISIP